MKTFEFGEIGMLIVRQLRRAAIILSISSLAIGSASATALNFDFSFVVTGGSVGTGTVTGEIFGLTDNATSAATDVVILTMPTGAPSYVPASPIDVFSSIASTSGNTFVVSNGAITSGTFLASFGIGGNDQIQLVPGTGSQGFPGYLNFQQLNNFMNSWSVFDSNTSAVLYTQAAGAAVPEPTSMALLATALIGVGAVRRRRI